MDAHVPSESFIAVILAHRESIDAFASSIAFAIRSSLYLAVDAMERRYRSNRRRWSSSAAFLVRAFSSSRWPARGR